MTMTSDPLGGGPSPDDIRAAVDRIIMSDVFSRSPQLGAFLRFVIESVLHGKSGRIKAYTIGVEVLRRDSKFDPQLDPIVRVEATRLRRALERYYAGPGAGDATVIDLPRGSYVPTFRRREIAVSIAARMFGPLVRWSMQLHARPMIASIAVLGIVAVSALAGFVVYSRIQQAVNGDGTPAQETVGRLASGARGSGNGMPTIYFEPLRVIGTPSPRAVAAELLYAKIKDAFARFDTINVSSVAPAGIEGAKGDADPPIAKSQSDYRLASVLEYAGGVANAWFTLSSTVDGTVVWSRTFERVVPEGGRGVTEDAIVVALTNSLLQSYGVIRARDRAVQLASNVGDPRYRCVLVAADSIRTGDHGEHDRARECLEKLTAIDPGFAVGFTFLALIYNREFQLGYALRPGDPPPLERALSAVRRSIALNPESSRGYLALMVVQFNRRDIAAALAAGDKCISLNKYDMLALGEYGGRLILAGDVDRGMRMLREAGEHGAVRPSWHQIYLFLGSYISGDLKEAAHYAGEIPDDNVALGQVAQVLVAQAAGDQARKQKAIDRLMALQPAWREDPHGELARLIADPGIVDRLARDLAAAGLPGRS